MKWTDRVGRRVKLRDLHTALAVAEAGSMTRAAEELAVSYPVVSKTISELEQTLGVKLFDRSKSGVAPTHYGRALLKSGIAVFDAYTLSASSSTVVLPSDPASAIATISTDVFIQTSLRCQQ
jgi:DNA-binding transcriptional LysR family regulator